MDFKIRKAPRSNEIIVYFDDYDAYKAASDASLIEAVKAHKLYARLKDQRQFYVWAKWANSTVGRRLQIN